MLRTAREGAAGNVDLLKVEIGSRDAAVETMRHTGEEMRAKYKGASLGGLVRNFPACESVDGTSTP